MGIDEAVKVALLAGTFGCAFAIITYPAYAKGRGWPVGARLRNPVSTIMIFACLAMFGAPVVAIAVFAWWTAPVVVVVGFILAHWATRSLEEHVQAAALVGLVVLWLVDILYVLP